MIGEGELASVELFGTEPLCRQECQIHRARENLRESGWLRARGAEGREGAACWSVCIY